MLCLVASLLGPWHTTVDSGLLLGHFVDPVIAWPPSNPRLPALALEIGCGPFFFHASGAHPSTVSASPLGPLPDIESVSPGRASHVALQQIPPYAPPRCHHGPGTSRIQSPWLSWLLPYVEGICQPRCGPGRWAVVPGREDVNTLPGSAMLGSVPDTSDPSLCQMDACGWPLLWTKHL